MRESGYYWVRTDENSDWEIALYSKNGVSSYIVDLAGFEWTINDRPISENDLFKVNKNRIKSPIEL